MLVINSIESDKVWDVILCSIGNGISHSAKFCAHTAIIATETCVNTN